MSKVSRKRSADKPDKPYPEYPLFAHPNGQWCKKIRGRPYYFGTWEDPQAALDRYLAEVDDLRAGRTPRKPTDGLRLHQLCNRFLNHKKGLVESGELKEETHREYTRICKLLTTTLDRERLVDDLVAEDYEILRAEMAKRWGPVRLGNAIQVTRSVFLYGYESGLLDKPMRFGAGFKKPSKRVLRVNQAEKGPRDFSPSDLKAVLKASDARMTAMIYLGINAGFGCTDCAGLPLNALDLKNGWLEHYREKTGIVRRIPLWKETVKAIKDYLKIRPTPAEVQNAGLAFILARGLAITSHRRISQDFAAVARAAGVNHTFYDLRRTFQTVGDEISETATKAIMGHAPKQNDMGAVYRQRVADDRLQAVVDHVRVWLYPPQNKAK